ncbi:PorV/PorQ family protein [Thermoproteota archaeon]
MSHFINIVVKLRILKKTLLTARNTLLNNLIGVRCAALGTFILLALASLVFIIPMPLIASDNAGAFLEKGLHPRPAGMGFSHTGLAQDSNAVYWNPAGLSELEGLDLSLMMTEAFDTQYSAFQIAKNWNGLGLGLTCIQAQMGGIQETVPWIDDRYIFSGNAYTYQAAAILMSLGKKVFNNLSLGVTGKIVYEVAADYSASGMGMDLGVKYEPFPNVTIGTNFQNIISPQMEWNTPSKNVDSIPFNLKTGAAYKPFDYLMCIADLDFRNKRKAKLHIGMEYVLSEALPIRAGLDDGKLTLGLGIYLGEFRCDFSWISPEIDEAADIYRFAISYFLINNKH